MPQKGSTTQRRINTQCSELDDESSKGNGPQIASRVLTHTWKSTLDFKRQFPNGTVVWSQGKWHRHPHNNWRHHKHGEEYILFCQECKFKLKLNKCREDNKYMFNKHGTAQCRGPIHGVIGIMNINFPRKHKRDWMTIKTMGHAESALIDETAPGGEPSGITSSSSITRCLTLDPAINKAPPFSSKVLESKETQRARSP